MLLNSHEAILHEDGVTYIWIMGFAIHLKREEHVRLTNNRMLLKLVTAVRRRDE